MKKLLFLKIILILSIVPVTSYAGDETGGGDGNEEAYLRRTVFKEQIIEPLKKSGKWEQLAPLVMREVPAPSLDNWSVIYGDKFSDMIPLERLREDRERNALAFDRFAPLLKLLPVRGGPKVIKAAEAIKKLNPLQPFYEKQLAEERKVIQENADEILDVAYFMATMDDGKELAEYNDILQKEGLEKITFHNPDETENRKEIQNLLLTLPAGHPLRPQMQKLNEELEQGQNLEAAFEKVRSDYLKEFSEKQDALKKHDYNVNQVQGAVTTLAFFVGLEDPKAAKVVSVIGEGAINLWNSIEKFGSLSKALEGIGPAALCGNIFGVVGGIMSALQPDPAVAMHTEVMKALEMISKQIESVKVELEKKLDDLKEDTALIIEKLDLISEQLSKSIREERFEFEELNTGIRGIDYKIYEAAKLLDSDLKRFDYDYYKAFQKGAPIYRKRFSESDFRQYNDSFSYHATHVAGFANVNGEFVANELSSTDIGIWQVLPVLSTGHLYGYLPKATRALLNKKPPMMSLNPDEWARGAGAYIGLILLQPENREDQEFKETVDENLENIRKGGEKIQKTIRSWRKYDVLYPIYQEYKVTLDAIYKTVGAHVDELYQARVTKAVNEWVQKVPVTDDGLTLFPPSNTPSNRNLNIALALNLVKLKPYWMANIKEVDRRKPLFYKYSYEIECGVEIMRVSDKQVLGWVYWEVPAGSAPPQIVGVTDWSPFSSSELENSFKEAWKSVSGFPPEIPEKLRFLFDESPVSLRDLFWNFAAKHEKYDEDPLGLAPEADRQQNLNRVLQEFENNDKNTRAHWEEVMNLFSSPGSDLYGLKNRLSALQQLLNTYMRLLFDSEFYEERLDTILLSGGDVVNAISPAYDEWKTIYAAHKEGEQLSDGSNVPRGWGRVSVAQRKSDSFERKLKSITEKYDDNSPTIPAVDDLVLILSGLEQMEEEKDK